MAPTVLNPALDAVQGAHDVAKAVCHWTSHGGQTSEDPNRVALELAAQRRAEGGSRPKVHAALQPLLEVVGNRSLGNKREPGCSERRRSPNRRLCSRTRASPRATEPNTKQALDTAPAELRRVQAQRRHDLGELGRRGLLARQQLLDGIAHQPLQADPRRAAADLSRPRSSTGRRTERKAVFWLMCTS